MRMENFFFCKSVGNPVFYLLAFPFPLLCIYFYFIVKSCIVINGDAIHKNFLGTHGMNAFANLLKNQSLNTFHSVLAF